MTRGVLVLRFEGGTVCLEGLPSTGGEHGAPPGTQWDARSASFRAPAVAYAALVMWLRKHEVDYDDQASAYEKLEPAGIVRQRPFPYQAEALEAWRRARGRGVVVLPTGSGKTYVATMAMDRFPRATLVVVPTIDLMNQWFDLLGAAFSQPIGIVGGGYHEVLDITVTTYDSAHIHMDRLGNRFGMVVFDECHHLPERVLCDGGEIACHGAFSVGPHRNTRSATTVAKHSTTELIGPGRVSQRHR